MVIAKSFFEIWLDLSLFSRRQESDWFRSSSLAEELWEKTRLLLRVLPPTAYRCSINPSGSANSNVGWRREHWTDEFRQVVMLPLCIPSHSLFPPHISKCLHLSLKLSRSSPPPFLFSLSLCLTRLVLSGVSLVDLVVEPHVGHSHAVLGQRARLVRADGGGGAESLYGLQVLHQAVLLGHSLGSESQTHLGGRREVKGGGGVERGE